VEEPNVKRTETVIIGGGQAGLAMSRCLRERGIDHVILERGRIGERWRSQRWDSLRLLTPNWQSRLPGWSYRGPDPDGFMGRQEVIAFLDGYSRSFSAPVETGVAVRSLRRDGSAFRVDSDRGSWTASNVVIATGNCDQPHVPEFAARMPSGVVQFVPSAYRSPADLPAGGVLVVGASATGIQLAEEIHASGRPVTLAVGRHTRLPRRYRGRDIQWWLDAIGVWEETAEAERDPERARREPSLQLVGSSEHRSLDLGVLRRQGVRLVGRALEVENGRLRLAPDLADSMAAAEERRARLLRRIDDHIARRGPMRSMPPADAAPALRAPAAPSTLDLRRSAIRTVVWATGYRRSYPWLRVPVLDQRGEIIHHHGVTPEPGLYVLGLQFQRTRKSSFLDGVGADARLLAFHIAAREKAARAA
jgi:putative flavoprotein involved in K+ transport